MAGKSAKAEVSPKSPNKKIQYFVFLALIAFAVYANSLSNGFVFDDESVVLGDPSLAKLSSIPQYFAGQEGFQKVIGRYYRPVVSSSYAIDYAIWGLKPFGFHLTNVIIHIVNSLLVFQLLMMLFAGMQSKFKDYIIFLGAALFAIHPIHTEAVAWVSGRTDSLFFTFFAAAFIFYMKYKEDSSDKNLILTCTFYFLSLLSKEMAITFPVVVILYEMIINRQFSLKYFLKEKFIYIALAVVSLLFLLVRWYALKNVPERLSYNYFYGKDLATTFFTMLQTIPYYFKMVLVPYGMVYHYGGFMPYLNSIANIEAIFPVCFIIALLACAALLLKRAPWVAYSILFIFLTLLPVLNIIPTLNFMADRFLYLPSLALSFSAIALVFKYYSPKRKTAVYTVVSVLIVGYLYLTVARNGDWKTNDTLFMSADGKPGSVLYVNIGNIYANKQDFDKAAMYYRKALDIRSETILANCNLGKVLMVKGNEDSAYFYMNKAYTLDTLSPEPMLSLALLFARTKKNDEAIAWLEKIQTISPGYMNSKQMLDELKGQKPGELPSMDQGNLHMTPVKPVMPDKSKLNPVVDSLERISYQLYQDKKYDKAIGVLKQLIKTNPSSSASYYNNIGMCYLDRDMYDDAVKSFELSIKEKEDFTDAYNNLGYTYQKRGNIDKAVETYNKAIQIYPDNADAKRHLKELGR